MGKDGERLRRSQRHQQKIYARAGQPDLGPIN
jgi:hypothetical protein